MELGSMRKRGTEAEARNWAELPAEVTSMILLNLGAVEILSSAQYVCSWWRKVCKDPHMWRVIDMHNLGDLQDDMYLDYDLEDMCKQAVDRSCGQLIDINIEYFGTDELLQHIAHSSNQLRRLRILGCYDITDEGLTEAVSKLPLLELLELSLCSFNVRTLEIIGRCCPLLKTLKLNKQFDHRGKRMMHYNDEALAIAETMPKLHHLQICGNDMTNEGLQAIIDGCPDLESLDLRKCLNLNLGDHFKEVYAENIKILHLPDDPIHSHESSPKTIYFHDCPDTEEESIYGFSGAVEFHYHFSPSEYFFYYDSPPHYR